ncbi:hypothetical protein B0H19DRAFT_1150525 [Mycena capillaripes]|nr:hypothetical protein B0H19DRAFT_1150525 [Mycena capillaripes]
MTSSLSGGDDRFRKAERSSTEASQSDRERASSPGSESQFKMPSSLSELFPYSPNSNRRRAGSTNISSGSKSVS